MPVSAREIALRSKPARSATASCDSPAGRAVQSNPAADLGASSDHFIRAQGLVVIAEWHPSSHPQRVPARYNDVAYGVRSTHESTCRPREALERKRVAVREDDGTHLVGVVQRHRSDDGRPERVPHAPTPGA